MEYSPEKGQTVTYEQWKPIPGHPGYEVSDLGRVRSTDRVIMRNGRPNNLKGRILTPHSNGPYGYKHLALGRGPVYYVHRLVALTFLGPPNEDEEVDHIDGDTSNNKLSNLRYLPHADNMTAHRERVSHCSNGHSYDDAYWCPKGKRHCRTCRREADKRRYARHGART